MSGDDDEDDLDENAPDSSGEIDVTGWSSADDETKQRKRNKRKRITLDMFSAPPLSLPTSRHDPILPAPSVEEGSSELALPDLRDLPRFAERARPPSTELAKVEDAWSRARDVPEAVPARPRTETPPPFPTAQAAAEATTQNDAISLVQRRSRPPGSSVLDLAGEMLDRFALGDFSGALLAAELVLGKDPTHAEAQRCAASCRDRLSAMHLARLGGAQRIPQIAVAGSEVRWLGLDHRAGFILSRVDGRTSIEELVDLSGMPRHEALKLLVELVEAGALSFSGR
ncbi:MAG: hypothetical protein U0234_16015 [Sandaracinus sp.]